MCRAPNHGPAPRAWRSACWRKCGFAEYPDQTLSRDNKSRDERHGSPGERLVSAPSKVGARRNDELWHIAGHRGELERSDCRRAIAYFKKIRLLETACETGAILDLSISGFDADPRELHQFPQVVSFCKRFITGVGLDDTELVGEEGADYVHPPLTLRLPDGRTFRAGQGTVGLIYTGGLTIRGLDVEMAEAVIAH
jgi:hypothetical protein